MKDRELTSYDKQIQRLVRYICEHYNGDVMAYWNSICKR